jgi:hypothetical protein
VRRLAPLLALALFGAASAARAEPPERIGPYRLEAAGDALVVRAQDAGSLAVGLVLAGLALAGVGAVRARAPGRRAHGRALVALGLALAGVGGVARSFGGTVWTASRGGLLVATRLGGERLVARAEIDHLALTRARPIGADVKPQARPRQFELHLRSATGASLAHFALESDAQARALGGELALALGVELR